MPETCVLCRSEPATRLGEHVLPKWYFRDRGPGPGPLDWSHNGELILDRYQRQIALDERVRVLLPVGESCNTELNRRFEPAKEALRRLFAGRANVTVPAEDVEPIALWFIKTLLLYAHPAVRYGNPLVDAQAVRWTESESDRRMYDWLVNGAAPPAGLSLWVFRSDEAEVEPANRFVVPLPNLTADGSTVDFVCFSTTWHGLNTTLVFHPGWEITHPMEAEGTAVRLWPDCPRGPLDLGALEVQSHRTVRWARCNVTLKDGLLGSPDLPPLEHSPVFMSVAPHLVQYTTHWGA